MTSQAAVRRIVAHICAALRCDPNFNARSILPFDLCDPHDIGSWAVAVTQIIAALEHEPIYTRSMLPFDPADPRDIGSWVVSHTATGRTRRRRGRRGRVARSLSLQALTVARNKRRTALRCKPKRAPLGAPLAHSELHRLRAESKNAKNPPVYGLEMLAQLAARPVEGQGWGDALEGIATLMAGTALAMIDATPGGLRARKATAMLSCLARTVASVRASFSDRITDGYISCLLNSTGFRSLPLSDQQRDSFASAIRRLEPGNNLRTALAAAQIPCVSAAEWKYFVEAARRRASRSNGETTKAQTTKENRYE